jgi:hypothetical protein
MTFSNLFLLWFALLSESSCHGSSDVMVQNPHCAEPGAILQAKASLEVALVRGKKDGVSPVTRLSSLIFKKNY